MEWVKMSGDRKTGARVKGTVYNVSFGDKVTEVKLRIV